MRVERVVCAVDCGIVVNPDTVKAQMEGGVIFGITAALWGEITLKNGRVEQSNFHNYRMLRINEALRSRCISSRAREAPGGRRRAGHVGGGPRRHQCYLCGHRQADSQAARGRWRSCARREEPISPR